MEIGGRLAGKKEYNRRKKKDRLRKGNGRHENDQTHYQGEYRFTFF